VLPAPPAALRFALTDDCGEPADDHDDVDRLFTS
jgi:hypothetical protein